jgi:beta-N-acetylhexosaminidase
MMVGVAAGVLDDPTGSIPTVPVGGIFLSGRSTSSAAEVLAGIQGIQKAVTRTSGVKAQVAVDQEGGYVQSLRGQDFPAIPTAVQQGQLDTSDLRDATAAWAQRLVQAGITLDLAPVADVVPAGTADENPPIGGQDRQYGSTPGSVGESVTTVVRAMLGAQLGTTVKHFPGLGRVTVNTDTSADAVDDQTTADDPSLLPFREAIAAGTTAVMISNATYPELDPDQPAAFSKKIITGLLRNSMHFDGLVISDDLGSAVAVAATPAGQRAVDFITAGGDMVLTVQPADLAPMTAALTAAAVQSPTFRARVDAAALHVLQSKQSLGLLSCTSSGIPSP